MNKYSDDDIKDDIRKVKEVIKKIPTQKEYSLYGKISLSLILGRKPWNSWLVELFSNTNHKITNGNGNGLKVSNKELLDNLKYLHDLFGRAPRQSELEFGKYGRAAYSRAFGSFSNALKKIGLTAKIQCGLTNEQLIDDLIRIYNEIGRTPSFEEFDKLSKTVSNVTMANRFGTWNKAVSAAGIPIVHNQKVSKEEVVEAIHKWVKDNDDDICCLEYYKLRKAGGSGKFPYAVNTISNKFDNISWEDIMKECGYDYETTNQFFKRGYFKGCDDITYLSSIEKQMGDFLFELKTQNRIKDYEYERYVCDEKTWTCDFVIKQNDGVELWLEVDGMKNARKNPYNSGENEKIEYYKNNNFNYFIVTIDMNDIKKTLFNKLFGVGAYNSTNNLT